jgi:hypothetical protein
MREAPTSRDRLRHPAVVLAALLVVFLCLIPPHGVLSENEEDYFQLALQRVSAGPVLPESAVFDRAGHRFLSDHLLGWLIRLIGFTGAQVTARAVAALAYAGAFAALVRRLKLDALDAVLVVIVFALLGQTLFGGEWLFNGFEAKVLAYALVLVGLAIALEGKGTLLPVLLFALASYFHFLVGIFWFFAAIALRLVADRDSLRPSLSAVGLFIAAIAPLLVAIVWPRLAAGPGTATAELPPPDFIYSIIRAPHHTSPFLDRSTFIGDWLPGYGFAAGMLTAVLVIAHLAETRALRSVARWLALLILYLFLALIPAALDRAGGVLGKFYLFRPAALVLLLWLCVVMAFLGSINIRHWRSVRLMALAVIAPLFLLHTGTLIAGELDASGDPQKSAIIHFIAESTAADSVVLVDPQVELSFLDLERRTGHPALVMWKFMPTDDPEIVEWYRRILFRKAIFADGCASRADPYHVDLLLAAPEHAALLAQSCGRVVYRNERFVLLRRS